VTSIARAPLLHANAVGDHVFFSFGASTAGPVAVWTAASLNQFTTLADSISTRELHISADGTIFSVVANGGAKVRATDLSLVSVPFSPELMQIPCHVFVPGVAVHPSSALIYQPFLTGQPSSAGVKGGVGVLDAPERRAPPASLLP
jgi:hypothetical protein